MTTLGIVDAINQIYSYLHAINRASIEHGYERLEELLLPAAFSGLVSELVVRTLAKELATGVPGLTRNLFPNGYPDLIPRATYGGDATQNGIDGIEVKAARNPSSIQSHNVASGWFAIVEFSCDTITQPVYDREPTRVRRFRVANLSEDDWTFSGRREGSRRTPTASINAAGRRKLDQGTVYLEGGTDGYETYRSSRPR